MITALKIIVVAGTASETGKTTLACSLLSELPGWEAIKLTRGHYRSCGKDPVACCVSHLLSERPTVFSDRPTTDIATKDTGRFWQAGASNVHWVVATDAQVEDGVCEAISRVNSPGVVIEGTSVLNFMTPSFTVLVAAKAASAIKASARRALQKGRVDAIYLPDTSAQPSVWSPPFDLPVCPPLFTLATKDALVRLVKTRIEPAFEHDPIKMQP